MKHPLALLALLAAFGQAAVAQEVKLVEQKDKQQIDVLVDGQPFTSYVYWSNQKKPLLSPLRTSQGNIFTRGFPLEKIAGERTDHPHHIASWFNYGDVNGTDFWNSPPEGYTQGYVSFAAQSAKQRSRVTANRDYDASFCSTSSTIFRTECNSRTSSGASSIPNRCSISSTTLKCCRESHCSTVSIEESRLRESAGTENKPDMISTTAG